MQGKPHAPLASAALALCLGACHSPAASPPQHSNVTNTTNVEVAVPNGGAQPVNRLEALNRATEQGPSPNVPAKPSSGHASPADFINRYAALLQAHQFDQAYTLLDPSMRLSKAQFEKRLSGYKMIDAAVGKVGPVEGAAGSLYATAQLTLTGEKADGTPYTLTGPVTLRRVNDVPGSTPEQRQWHIYKMDLSSNPKTAEKLVKRQTKGG